MIIITPDSLDYEKARQEWNRSIQKFPKLIAYCETTQDVSDIIKYSYDNGLRIRIRSGGHNYEGYSTGNDVVVIDISKMNNANINYEENTVTVQGGIKNTQLYNYISNQGYPFPGGTCPTVGVSGYALGGGWGYSARKFGLGCDSLIEIEMVNYKGKIIKANKYFNKDLFWALRGSGGGNFGVITSMKFKLPHKVNKVTYVRMTYQNISKKEQVNILDTWQKWIGSVDKDINLSGGLYHTNEEGVYAYFRGISYKNEEQTRKLLEPFYNIKEADIILEYDKYIDVVNQIASSYPPYEHFKSTGRFVNKYYYLNELEKLVDIINQPLPNNSIYTGINVYGLGGEVKSVNKYDTAFYFRDANYILLIQSAWEDNLYKEENVNWVLNNFKYIYSITEGSYINFPLLQLPYYESNYFGENSCRLRKVKCKYDPLNVFSFPQSIRY